MEKLVADQVVDIAELKSSNERMIGELSTMVAKVRERDDLFGADLTEHDRRLNRHRGEINRTDDKVGTPCIVVYHHAKVFSLD